ncbi:PAS domain S-box-containing protein [Streptomyces sp. DvalAA-14]|uniref:SpoIIE family protein phosphatase n=1 Tax=unclassified Streptomyces TaxID=2593676 RepID=UPI00081B84A9|nr:MULTISPECIES: SpoIIE family protein phosphatase [unclassified Streptomyces]MYS19047.1 SpoIIE family protein phosphatase [Streptomyces sp. SID4948]SCD35051.1 PAS domain S-box-containing protein [Streptomyces sp. DvalAA-14]
MAESSRGKPWSAEDTLGLVGAATAVVDGDGIVLGWTVAAERATGYTAEEVVGRPAARLLADCETAAELAAWAARARAREPWSGVVQLRPKDGPAVRMMIEASPLTGSGRTDWFVTATDPTGSSSWSPARSSVSAALMARSPIGLSIWDTDLRCIWLNSAAERQDGLLRRQRLGRLMTEVQPGNAGKAISSAMQQVLDTGESIIEREYTWQIPGEDEERVLSASYFRLDGADGRPIGVCNMATDIDKSRARQHLLILGQAGNRIGTTLDVIKTAQELADAAVPLMADYVSVDLGETVPLGEEPLQRLPPSDHGVPVFRRAGLASIHEGIPESPWRVGEAVFVARTSPFARVLFSGETYFEPVIEMSPGSWLQGDPARAKTVEDLGLHSLIVVPLQARGTVLGEAVFLRSDNKVPFSADDLLLIEELVGRASLSLDNARRYTRERAASIALQRNLLPHNLSGGGAVELASRYLPADTHEGVGGDWFDAIPLPDARVGLVVGDVVGHGINAAALMGQLRTIMRTLADQDLPPQELLARLDRLILLMTEQDGNAEGFAGPVMSCTCAYAVYDPVTGTCTMASAGHPPPAVLWPDGHVTFPDVPPGPPIGMGLMSYEPFALELPENSTLALYTDGLIETRTADLDTGMGRLGSALALAGKSLDHLCSQVVGTMAPHAWQNIGAGPEGTATTGASEDDIALLLARTRVMTSAEAAAQRRF